MVRVMLDDVVLAESSSTVIVEDNYYFPPKDVHVSLFDKSDTSTVCPWKGTAAYYSVNLGGKSIKDIAWYYPAANDKAKHIEGYIAFYKNKVRITD